MLFSSTVFIFYFLPIVVGIHFLIKENKIRNIFLLFSSVIFYIWGGPKYLIVIIYSAIISYLGALFIDKFEDKNKKKISLIATVLLTTLSLIYFKYSNFLVDNINRLDSINIQIETIILPLGISFFTFQALSYVFDVYTDKVKVQKNILDYFLYLTLFPQLIAGPIVRYIEVKKEIIMRTVSMEDIDAGARRFIIGLAKKMIIANNIALVADQISELSQVSIVTAWLSIFAFTMQIYFDFSGYSDMAIGIGRMLGFHFPENFNFPYISRNIIDFWRRWHITLSMWFRDYMYIPLGGNRVNKMRWVFNLFIVWFTTGFWHGAEWTFILWGLYFFVFIVIERTFLLKILNKIPITIQILYSFIVVMLGWVLFRANDISSAFENYSNLLDISKYRIVDPYSIFFIRENILIILISIIFSTPLMYKIHSIVKNQLNKKMLNLYLNILIPSGYIFLFIISVFFVVSSTFNPFIYFRF